MTEDEAIDKACPFMGCNCRASNCMAWQFDAIRYEDGTPLPVGSKPADSQWEKDGEQYWHGTSTSPAGGRYMQRWRRPLPLGGECKLCVVGSPDR
jgi:hypothetical protein